MPRILARVLTLVLSCSAFYPQHPLVRTEEPLPETPQLRLERYFATRTQMLGNSRAEIMENLGKPKRERTDEDLRRANELTSEEARRIRGHDTGVENEIMELAYDGLYLRILKVNSPPYREFVYDITVTSDRYKMLWNLNVGSPRQEIRRILGKPSKSDELQDSYLVVHSSPPEGYTDLVIFGYHDNFVDRVRFWLYLD